MTKLVVMESPFKFFCPKITYLRRNNFVPNKCNNIFQIFCNLVTEFICRSILDGPCFSISVIIKKLIPSPIPSQTSVPNSVPNSLIKFRPKFATDENASSQNFYYNPSQTSSQHTLIKWINPINFVPISVPTLRRGKKFRPKHFATSNNATKKLCRKFRPEIILGRNI